MILAKFLSNLWQRIFRKISNNTARGSIVMILKTGTGHRYIRLPSLTCSNLHNINKVNFIHLRTTDNISTGSVMQGIP